VLELNGAFFAPLTILLFHPNSSEQILQCAIIIRDAFCFKTRVRNYFSHLIKDGIVERTGMECGYNEDTSNMEKDHHYSQESLCIEKH